MDSLAPKIEVKGPISVEPVTSIPQRNAYNILLLGPTGSGKSAFIESIAGHGTLNISKNQLESVTQHIQAYRIKGVDMRWLISSRSQRLYLIDTPGFLDTRISEMKVVLMLKEWLKETDILIDHTLYFDRITDIRLNKSRHTCLNIFKSIVTGVSNCELTIVTTMWDQIWNDELRSKAEVRLNELGEYWGEYIKPTPRVMETGSQPPPGAKLVQFHNTRESAMEILSACIVPVEWTSNASTALETMLDDGQTMSDTSFGPLLKDALMDRIERLRLQHQNVVEELADEELMEELPEYCAILIEKKEVVEHDLKRYEDELEEYRGSSLPEGSGDEAGAEAYLA